MIRLQGISKYYPSSDGRFYALKQVNLHVRKGESVAIRGRSGAGKSTLLHILGCLDTYSEGTYFLDGKDISDYSLTEAAKLIADATKAKNNIWIFGCSHAGIIAEEAFYRSGGMVTINPILFPGFMLNTRPVTMTSKLERLPGLAKIIAEENKLRRGDVLFIHSVSGRKRRRSVLRRSLLQILNIRAR